VRSHIDLGRFGKRLSAGLLFVQAGPPFPFSFVPIIVSLD
jgi:hypothetical protein